MKYLQKIFTTTTATINKKTNFQLCIIYIHTYNESKDTDRYCGNCDNDKDTKLHGQIKKQTKKTTKQKHIFQITFTT